MGNACIFATVSRNYLHYDKMKKTIVADLETKYSKLSLTDSSRSFNMTDDVFIDGGAIEEILAPY